jgi:hypothetical protein
LWRAILARRFIEALACLEPLLHSFLNQFMPPGQKVFVE